MKIEIDVTRCNECPYLNESGKKNSCKHSEYGPTNIKDVNEIDIDCPLIRRSLYNRLKEMIEKEPLLDRRDLLDKYKTNDDEYEIKILIKEFRNRILEKIEKIKGEFLNY